MSTNPGKNKKQEEKFESNYEAKQEEKMKNKRNQQNNNESRFGNHGSGGAQNDYRPDQKLMGKGRGNDGGIRGVVGESGGPDGRRGGKNGGRGAGGESGSMAGRGGGGNGGKGRGGGGNGRNRGDDNGGGGGGNHRGGGRGHLKGGDNINRFAGGNNINSDREHEHKHGQFNQGPPRHMQNVNRFPRNNSNDPNRDVNNNNQFMNCPNVATGPEASSDVQKFWFQLSEKLENHRDRVALLNLKNHNEITLWLQCWAAAAAGAPGPVSALPKALKLLPAAAITTPPLEIAIRVLYFTVKNMECPSSNTGIKLNSRGKPFQSNNKSTEYDGVSLLETVADIVRDRLDANTNLISNIEETTQHLKELEVEFSKKTIQYLNSSDSHQQNRLASLLMRVREIEKFRDIVSQRTSTAPATHQLVDNHESPWLGWKDFSTVGWLMSGSWHLVPELKSIYTSPDEYAETLLRVWTLLTFYWGTGAVWPRCSHRQGGAGGPNDMPCGEPLLSHNNHGTCSMRRGGGGGGHHCGAPASWHCHRYGHDAICTNCLRLYQKNLTGPPSQVASTDIYDAVVERESSRHDGTVYILSKLASRKPPKIAPNWRTSYRLQPSALVGIVKLSVSGEPLDKHFPIQWAEIVPIDVRKGGNEDHVSRARGFIALRILSRNDCSALSSDCDTPLYIGTRVAIIDLRVFVPEVISVLSTFAKDSFISQIKQIPFIEQLVGMSSQPYPLQHIRFEKDISSVISLAITRSQMEVLQRLNYDQRSRIVQRICAQRQVKSLYGTQLEAFAAGLACAIHCTQGPPGTGKSYVGVCLVTAYDIIRQEAAAAGHPLGPVLMLSYKNHALDEFLLDVIKFSPMLKPGMLIRSGKPEHPSLLPYAERSSGVEKDAMQELTSRVNVLRHARSIIKAWNESSSQLESLCVAEQVDIFDQKTKSILANIFVPFQLSVALCVWLFLHREDLKLNNAPAYMLPSKAYRILNSLKSPDDQSLLFNDKNVELQAELVNTLKKIWFAGEHWLSLNDCRTYHLSLRDRPLYLLEKWLYGLIPPPRCRAVINDDTGEVCKEIAMHEDGYCKLLHGCLSQFGCKSVRVKFEIPFCESHCCRVDHDGRLHCRERIEGSECCEQHSCVSCIITGTKPIGRRGLVACELHRCMAPANRGRCAQAQLLPHKFCKDHCCGVCARTGIVTNLPATANHLCDLHRCSFPTCGNLVLGPTSNLCAAHICRECAPSAIKVVDVNLPQSRLCADHRCEHPEYVCKHTKFPSSPYYCLAHTCRVCLDQGIPTQGPVVDDPPRNHCMQHPLCEYDFPNGGQCHAVAISGGCYCFRHTATLTTQVKLEKEKSKQKVKVMGDGQCWGIKKKNKERCKAKGDSPTGEKWYCDAHAEQALECTNDADVEEEDDNDNEDISREEEKLQRELESVVAAADAAAADNNLNMINYQLSQEAQLLNNYEIFNHLPRFVPCFGLLTCSSVLPCTTTVLTNVQIADWCCPLHDHKALYPSYHDPTISKKEEKSLETVKDFAELTEEIKQHQVESKVVDSSRSNNRDMTASKSLPQQNIPLLEDPVNLQMNLDAFYDANINIAMDDDLDFMDAVAGDVHPDELDFIPDEENENLMRLRDMVDDENDDTASEDSMLSEGTTGDDAMRQDGSAPEVHEDEITSFARYEDWSWEMSPRERWSSVAAFLRGMGNAVSKLRVDAEDFVAEARRDKSEASAHAYRSARIIGATVVGAARRLEAIRAAEPFAVVVEEACEVMEPTLMAVLAVKSLRKLELVGDHRQLPAFIQNCWFNLESSLPSIKTSLFERLISGKVARMGGRRRQTVDAADPVPSTVLDEQRRMRKRIADLTRPDYEDIVDIKDHAHTKTQTVGSGMLSHGACEQKMVNKFKAHQKLWPDKGRQIPGMSTSVYFWNVRGNKESRPVAGLSACNVFEATAVANLTSWLITCGVPPPSISIITPYKGQKSAIITALRKVHCMPPFQRDQPPAAGTTLTVSTVDRYQGDENDVVILSLVRTQPGNRFVGLLNRFIVAVSRARLGFYIIGSVDAVIKNRQGGKGPEHWNRLVDQLSSSSTTTISGRNRNTWKTVNTELLYDDEDINNIIGTLDSDDNNDDNDDDDEDEDYEDEEKESSKTGLVVAEDEDNDISYTESRVGEQLPICCPRHPASTAKRIVDSESFPKSDAWNVFCKENCDFILPYCHHQCQLLCHSPSQVTHTQHCQVLVPRPCIHHFAMNLKCCDLKLKLGEDIKDAIARFQCDILESYARPECEHIVRIPCHQKVAVEKGRLSLPDCEEVVGDFIHPRCGHKIKAPKCVDRRKFEKNPPDCKTNVKFKRPCGCTSDMPCGNAVKEREKPTRCLSSVEKKRPRCSHPYTLRCHVASSIEDQWMESEGIPATVSRAGNITVTTVEEGQSYGSSEYQLSNSIVPNCAVEVLYKRTCGHMEFLPCEKAFQAAAQLVVLSKCAESVPFDSPICGHKVNAPCWAATKLVEWKPWEPIQLPLPNADGKLILPEAMLDSGGNIANLEPQYMKILHNICSRHVQIARSCGIDHFTTLNCNKLLPLLQKKSRLPDCSSKMDRVLPCHHIVPIQCCERLLDPPVCRAAVDDIYTYPCGIHWVYPGTCVQWQRLNSDPNPQCLSNIECQRYRCGHTATIPCYLKEEVTAETPGERITRIPISDGSNDTTTTTTTQIVVYSDELYCSESEMIKECTERVSYCYPCKHIKKDVLCRDAFAWSQDNTLSPACTEIVDYESPLCGHTIKCPCSLISSLQAWNPWEGQKIPDINISQGINSATGDIIITREIKWCDPEPKKLPYLNLEKHLKCNGNAVLVRECGHTKSISCLEGYLKKYRKCAENVKVTCHKEGCMHETSIPCHLVQEAVRQDNGYAAVFTCKNLVLKVCDTCHINKIETECYKEITHCMKAVTANRTCGHEVTWNCGTDDDPRSDNLSLCRQCILPQWRAVVEYQYQEDDGVRLDKLMRKMVLDSLEELGEVSQLIPLDVTERMKSHIGDGRGNVNKATYEMLKSKPQAKLVTPPPAIIGCVEDGANYKIVFRTIIEDAKQLNNKKSDTREEDQVIRHAVTSFTTIGPTFYGPGVTVKNLTTKNLASCAPAEDGTLKICVGVAYIRKYESNIPPFRTTDTKKAKEHAKKTSQHFKKEGVDSVELINKALLPVDGQEKNELLQNNTGHDVEYICWVPGVTVPLYVVTMKLHVQCSTCLEHYAASDGYFCSKKHFICYESCFGGYVNSASQPDAIGRSIDKDGNLKCPQCDEFIDYQKVSSKEACELLLNLRIKIHSERMLKEGLEVQRLQLQAEYNRIQAIQDIDEREAELIRRQIIDDILVLRCPRAQCRGVFVDFEGCFALTCHCRAAFCAWCLVDCGVDAHAHVLQCPQKPAGIDSYFGTKEQFDEHHRKRREGLVNQKYRGVKPSVRDRLRRLLEPDLRDLNIKLDNI